ncbi:MAG TPA: dTDP-4-dehydrorhamnose reductase [Acidobacteriaceae bacterium]
MNLLVTGGTGQLGRELQHTLAPLGTVFAPPRETLDLADPASIRATIRAVRPRWIVNAGAYTAVDKAESEPNLAYAINRDAVRIIGEEACATGAAVVHLSTDYVFDGASTAPYVETDPTGPISVYGSSKLAGEAALAATGAAHLIFRTSWVYGSHGKNFLLTILKLVRERETLRVVADQHGSPTWSRDLARMIASVLSQVESRSTGSARIPPFPPAETLYHACGAGETTWYDFAAAAVALQQQSQPLTRLAHILPIPSADYPTAARRPQSSRMCCDKLLDHYGWQMMDWRESLRQVLDELAP